MGDGAYIWKVAEAIVVPLEKSGQLFDVRIDCEDMDDTNLEAVNKT